MPEPIRKSFDTTTKALDDTRSLIVTITTPTPDRAGDVVEPKGALLDNFRKNPVVLFGHDYHQPPVAKADELSVSDTGITAKVTFPSEGSYPFADAIYNLYKEGVMNAWSIGFQSKAYDLLPDQGVRYTEWEMMEFSAVPVPMNAEALTIMRSYGLDEKQIEKAAKGEGPEPVVDPPVLEDQEPPVVEEPEDKPIVEEPKVDEPTQVDEVEVDEAGKSVTVTLPTGVKYLFIFQTIKQIEAVKEGPSVEQQLSGMRDMLKASDKNLGLALKSMKSILDQSKGGESN